MKDVTFYYVPDVAIDKTSGRIVEILRPKIPVRLSAHHNISKILVDCLFDTGSDRNLFPADWGRSLGLKIEKGKKVKIGGIGGKELIAYTHKVTLHIQGAKIVTEADFSNEQNTPLLGRIGFMDKVEEIIINEKKRYIKISF